MVHPTISPNSKPTRASKLEEGCQAEGNVKKPGAPGAKPKNSSTPSSRDGEVAGAERDADWDLAPFPPTYLPTTYPNVVVGLREIPGDRLKEK